MNDLLSRKFIFAMVSIFMSFYLVVIGKVTVNEFFNFVSLIGGIYVIGNLGTQIINKE